MNKGKDIFDRQNLDINIDKLLAQRRLYSNAKKVNYILISLTVFIPIIISLIVNFTIIKINDKNWIYVLYTVVAIVLEKIFEIYIDRCKKTAASIQEDFDTTIFPISENELLNTTYVDSDIIRKYSKKDKNIPRKVNKVTNWYSKEIENIDTNIAILFCQRMNICYDQNIKKKYNILLIILSFFTFLILLGFSLFNNFSLMKFMIEVILPSIPIFTFTYKEFNTNLESVDNLQKLREIIEQNLNSISINDSIDVEELRRIQDRIYQNRILSPLIPDFIYSFLWSELEDQMNYSVKTKIEEIS
ncbi:S-4TM family putative pore-forming effector [Flavobacterium sp. B183]|uniref:S-4TM family putative pore-forming effector n=1 Tax=Flavobacterium sp. B183 TaxID=907046 RepID=UPI00201F5871|nr:S-4TM family putative pore-forming effector [Flavobacterium sp. B183]URC14826.1 S-4TM family putative pore-forming effector [Flavobacterium sp. B183]